MASSKILRASMLSMTPVMPRPSSFGQVEIVDPAEDHGHAREQLPAVVHHELQGVVVRDHGHVELLARVLPGVELAQPGGHLRVRILLGVHVLDLQVYLHAAVVEHIPEAAEDVVRPGIAVVVGIEEQDRLALLGPGGADGAPGQDQQCGGNPVTGNLHGSARSMADPRGSPGRPAESEKTDWFPFRMRQVCPTSKCTPTPSIFPVSSGAASAAARLSFSGLGPCPCFRTRACAVNSYHYVTQPGRSPAPETSLPS